MATRHTGGQAQEDSDTDISDQDCRTEKGSEKGKRAVKQKILLSKAMQRITGRKRGADVAPVRRTVPPLTHVHIHVPTARKTSDTVQQPPKHSQEQDNQQMLFQYRNPPPPGGQHHRSDPHTQSPGTTQQRQHPSYIDPPPQYLSYDHLQQRTIVPGPHKPDHIYMEDEQEENKDHRHGDQQLQRMELENKRLKREKEMVENTLLKYEAQLAAKDEEISRMRKVRTEPLHRAVQGVTSDQAKLEMSLVARTAEITQLTADKNLLEHELHELQTKYKCLIKEKDAATHQVDTVTHQWRTAQEMIGSMEEKNRILTENLQRIGREKEESLLEQQHKDRIKQLEDELRGMDAKKQASEEALRKQVQNNQEHYERLLCRAQFKVDEYKKELLQSQLQVEVLQATVNKEEWLLINQGSVDSVSQTSDGAGASPHTSLEEPTNPMAELTDQIAELKTKLDHEKLLNHELEKTVSRLQTDIAAHIETSTAANLSVKELQVEVGRRNVRLQELEEESADRAEEAKSFKELLRQSDAEIEQLKNARKEKANHLQTMQQIIESLSRRLEMKDDKHKGEMAKLDMHNKEYEEKLGKVMKQYGELSIQHSELSADFESLKKQHLVVEELQTEAVHSLNAKSHQLEELQNELAIAETHVARLSQELEENRNHVDCETKLSDLRQQIETLQHFLRQNNGSTITTDKVEGLCEAKERGRGCYGAVYEVQVYGVPCIAKRLHDILVGRGKEERVGAEERAGILSSFRRECALLSGLRHPNVVQFIGVHCGSDEADISLIMEYMHMDLGDCIKRYPSIPLPYKASILRDVAYGLAYLHSMSIIHRDLNTGNVLLTESLRAKIADLGMSKLFDRKVVMQRTKTVCPGALDFMPPESLTKAPKYSDKLDIFSFGHLTVFLVNQEEPHVDDNSLAPGDVARKQIQFGKRREALDQMSHQLGGSRHPLYSTVVQCLSDTPDQRPTSRDLVKRMEEICQQHPIPHKNTLETIATTTQSQVAALEEGKHNRYKAEIEQSMARASRLEQEMEQLMVQNRELENRNAQLKNANQILLGRLKGAKALSTSSPPLPSSQQPHGPRHDYHAAQRIHQRGTAAKINAREHRHQVPQQHYSRQDQHHQQQQQERLHWERQHPYYQQHGLSQQEPASRTKPPGDGIPRQQLPASSSQHSHHGLNIYPYQESKAQHYREQEFRRREFENETRRGGGGGFPQSHQQQVYSSATKESSSGQPASDTSDVPENPLIEEDMLAAQDEVHKMYADPNDSITDPEQSFEIPFDPNLVCPKCGRQFRRGEIQKFRKHHEGCSDR